MEKDGKELHCSRRSPKLASEIVLEESTNRSIKYFFVIVIFLIVFFAFYLEQAIEFLYSLGCSSVE